MLLAASFIKGHVQLLCLAIQLSSVLTRVDIVGESLETRTISVFVAQAAVILSSGACDCDNHNLLLPQRIFDCHGKTLTNFCGSFIVFTNSFAYINTFLSLLSFLSRTFDSVKRKIKRRKGKYLPRLHFTSEKEKKGKKETV